MATYTVQSGDNLSTIAKRFGITDYSKITGYKSGNPNLIYAGEILNIPDATPTPNYSTAQGPVYVPPPTGTTSPTPSQTTRSTSVAPTTQTNPIQAPPMQSLTSVGQNYLNTRQQASLPVDELSIKQLYRDRGFEDTYGDWRGSDVQYKAMWMQDIQEGVNKLNERVATEGITDDQGNVLQAPTRVPGEQPSISNQPTQDFIKPTGDDFKRMTDDILKSIGTTDIAKLIQDFSSGDLTTPELELSKEDRDAKLEELKAAAAKGLAGIQEGLASRGMTFSGIRTEKEAGFAAEVLSRETGINRAFAARIINAARQEQSRRETALKAAEDNYNDALEKMGYVYNPITNTIEPTLARERAAQSRIMNVGGNLVQYDPETGQLTTLYEAPEKERNLNIHYEEDSNGNVTKIVTDPTSGQTISTEQMGRLGKGTTSTTGTNTYKSGSLTIANSSIAQGQSNLDSSRGSDGYANSGTYLQMLAAWKKDGGLEQDFFTKYPPKNYLNPRDTSIPTYIREKLSSETESKLDQILNKL